MKLFHHIFIWALLIIPFHLQAQSIETLKVKRDSLKTVRKSIQQQLGRTDKSIDSLRKEIEILSGWRLDWSTIVGLNFSRTNNWVGNANPNAITSNLSIAGTFSAQKNNRKSFWRNNSTLNLAWQGVDIDTDRGDRSRFLEDRTADIFAFSTLYGFNVNRFLSFSTLGDINTTLFDFLNTGSLNISSGLSWSPPKANNLVIVGHFLSYQIAYKQDAEDQQDNDNAFGAKLKISYAGKLPLKIKWTSNFNTFIPYSNPEEGEKDLFEYTWINNLSVKFWKSLGIGVNIGVRKADFETVDTQWFNTLGISVAL